MLLSWAWLLLCAAETEEVSSLSMLQRSLALSLAPRTAASQASQASRGTACGPDQVYNLHIPKSAGSSFALDAQKILQKAQLRIISQEGCFSLHRQNAHLKGTITMLREPRAHVLSQYKMCRSHWVTQYREALSANSSEQLPGRFADWVAAWRRRSLADFSPPSAAESPVERTVRQLRTEAWGQPPYSVKPTVLRVEDWAQLDGGGTVWHCTKVPFQCYAPVNLQSQRLTCEKPLKYDSSINTTLLMQNLNALWFVGFAEAYQASVCLLHWRVLHSLPQYCDCADRQRWQEFHGHTENQNSTYYGEEKLAQLRDTVLQDIDALTATDRLLYKAAWDRFVRESADVARESGKQILCNASVPLPH
ncbi:unnamed protein product [Effrenium voratum]|uniref:Uncharacterized protein n=1 Tax=Effrenium voratum TaxID=2562239 RepID=A0AA36JAX0_9DINO|nr:unnamed protein product [Effrenium voratum]